MIGKILKNLIKTNSSLSTTTTTTTVSKKNNPQRMLLQVQNQEKMISIMIVVLAVSLLLITIDLIKDRTFYDKATNMQLELNQQISDLQKELFANQKEIFDLKNNNLRTQEIVDCMRYTDYWKYKSCF